MKYTLEMFHHGEKVNESFHDNRHAAIRAGAKFMRMGSVRERVDERRSYNVKPT